MRVSEGVSLCEQQYLPQLCRLYNTIHKKKDKK
jgi:hypothetical protein